MTVYHGRRLNYSSMGVRSEELDKNMYLRIWQE